MKEPIAKAPSGRPVRQPVGTTNRLEIINKDPDRVYRLIDSSPSRLSQFERAGYRVENVNEHIPGLRISVPNPTDNTLHVGGGKQQILVSIEKEFYEEDQRAKRKRTLDMEEAMKTPSEGFYGKVTIER